MTVMLAVSAPAGAADFSDDDLLLLDFVLDRQRLGASVTAYAYGDTALVSLAEVAGALEFPIVVTPESGTASGWFIAPERSFSLDMDGGFVDIAGSRSRFDRSQVLTYQNNILVTLDTLARWFPVDFSLDPRALTVVVSPRERLPAQERAERRRQARGIGGVGPATLPRIDTPYSLLGPHAADVGLGYSIKRNTERGNKPTTGLSYSALISGDVAFMDSRIYLGGNRNDALSHARLSLSRDNLGGPLGLRYIEIGDIVAGDAPGLGYSGLERGILIQGGGSLTGRDDLIDGDNITINGDALPGWDVELFQNGMRVGFQTVGQDGRYNFTGLQPLAGENDFELVFYGPSGERRTERVTRYGGLAPDQPGSVRYQLSVSQKGRQLYEGDAYQPADDSNPGSTRISTALDVRVLPGLALRGAWNSVMIDGERQNLTTLGARGRIGSVQLGLDATRDGSGDTRWDGSIQLPASMRVGGFDTRLTHTHYAQSARVRSALEGDDYETRLSSRTQLTLTGPIGPLSTRFALSHDRELTRTTNTASAGFTARSGGVVFGNTLNYRRYGATADGLRDPDSLTGNLFFSTRFHPLSVRGGVSYSLRPDAQARQYYIDSTLQIADDMSMNFGLSRDPLQRLTRYTSGFNWHLPLVTLSPRITYDSNGDYAGYIYASFSLAPRPDRPGVLLSGRSMASSGTVAARVFIDHDGSGTFTPGDEPLPGVGIQAPQAGRTADTDAQGVAYLTRLGAGQVTDVRLNSDTLPSTQLASRHAGNSVRARPTAATVIDFPVIPTSDIEGRVYIVQHGMKRALQGAMVELRSADGQVVDFKVSGHDGYYLFSQVPYGNYALALAGERGERANTQRLTVDRSRDVYGDIDITYTAPARAQPLLQAPASPAAAANPAPIAPPAPAAPAAPAAPPAPAAPRPLAAAQAPSPAAPSARPAGGRVVQLGAFGTPESARAHRDAIVARGLLQAAQIDIVASNRGAQGTLHRVLATPAGGSAENLCNTLKARGEQCITTLR